MATAYRPERDEETHDRPSVAAGHVQEVKREWLVRTDEQLARRVQDEEIVLHLTDNRHRNEQIREDFPTASAVQARTDSIARMEEEIRQKLIEDDAKLARKLHSAYESKESRKSSKMPKNISNLSVSHNNQDPSRIMVPDEMKDSRASSSTKLSKNDRKISNSHQKHSQSHSGNKSSKSTRHLEQAAAVLDDVSEELDELGRVLGEPSNELKKEKERLMQEEEDAEIARRLENGNEDIEDKDRLLAHILQEKEYARYRKSDESHRPKQKHKNRSHSLGPSVQLSDTYSIPHDILQGNVSNFQLNESHLASENNLHDNNDSHYMIPIEEMNRHTHRTPLVLSKDIKKIYSADTSLLHQQPRNGHFLSTSNRIDEYSEDPHYMEVLADLPSDPPQNQMNNGIYKGYRAPPETPQFSGRPKLAEPPAINRNCVLPDTANNENHVESKKEGKKNKKKKSQKREDSGNRKCSSRCTIL